ncbi:hypothetical protein C4J81_18230 [Deltaproteobacteria bacterium Smac51]|nr:hypothetical protein C4J81_18230 [Deltaproteobacteria bacterium Smac51]
MASLKPREEKLLKLISDRGPEFLPKNALKEPGLKDDLGVLVGHGLVEPRFVAKDWQVEQFMRGDDVPLEEFDVYFSLTDGGHDYLDETYTGTYNRRNKFMTVAAIIGVLAILGLTVRYL